MRTDHATAFICHAHFHATTLADKTLSKASRPGLHNALDFSKFLDRLPGRPDVEKSTISPHQ
jgi:hypothetical protein